MDLPALVEDAVVSLFGVVGAPAFTVEAGAATGTAVVRVDKRWVLQRLGRTQQARACRPCGSARFPHGASTLSCRSDEAKLRAALALVSATPDGTPLQLAVAELA